MFVLLSINQNSVEHFSHFQFFSNVNTTAMSILMHMYFLLSDYIIRIEFQNGDF